MRLPLLLSTGTTRCLPNAYSINFVRHGGRSRFHLRTPERRYRHACAQQTFAVLVAAVALAPPTATAAAGSCSIQTPVAVPYRSIDGTPPKIVAVVMTLVTLALRSTRILMAYVYTG